MKTCKITIELSKNGRIKTTAEGDHITLIKSICIAMKGNDIIRKIFTSAVTVFSQRYAESKARG